MAGISGDVPVSVAEAVCDLMVLTGRTVPPQKYVEFMIEQAEVAAFEGLI